MNFERLLKLKQDADLRALGLCKTEVGIDLLWSEVIYPTQSKVLELNGDIFLKHYPEMEVKIN